MPQTVTVPISVTVTELGEVLQLAHAARDTVDHAQPHEQPDRDLMTIPGRDWQRLKAAVQILLPGIPQDGES